MKDNNLIEARYCLSLQESRIILWLLTQIRLDDEDFKEHTMDVKEFGKMINVEVDNQYSKLRSITKRLIQRALEIYERDKKEWLQVSWLSSCEYQENKGSVTLRFDPRMKPYLLELKDNFTKIGVSDIIKLKSIYSIRIFELLLQYKTIGKREISIDDLRSYCAIEKNEYSLYADLKRKVINRAKKEINDKTEYDIDYQEIKKSRKVVSINWIIKKRTFFEKFQLRKADIIEKELLSTNIIIDRIMEYGFSKKTATKFMQERTEKQIQEAITAVDIQVKKGKVKNSKAMLIKAIQEKWDLTYKTRKAKIRSKNILKLV